MLMLILPFILLGGILAHRNRSKAWKSMVAPRLRKQLVIASSQTRRWISLVLGLLGAALLIVVIARPYVGHTTTTEQISTRNILIAIDTSRSMLVRDGSPDRMASAQAAALELLNAFPNDRVGVIAFSGTPMLMVPLTIDHAAVHETISQLDTSIIPAGGSNLNAAVQLALKTFEKTGQKGNALILISDGENHSQETKKTADAIRKSGVTVCAISVGSEAGGIIPDPRKRDGKFRDHRGQTVLSRMIPEALDTLSRAGHGTYLPASAGTTATISATLTSIKRQEQQGRKRTIPSERYQWFLLPAILLLTLSLLIRSQLFRKKRISSPVVTTLLLYLLINPLEASTIDKAREAYDNHDYSPALTLFKVARNASTGEERHAIEFAMGATAYRLHHWEQAATYFSAALVSSTPQLQEHAHYNLAQALFRFGLNTLNPDLKNESSFKKISDTLFEKKLGGEIIPVPTDKLQKTITAWQDAIIHYQSTIDLNPNNSHAITNLKNVQILLERLICEEEEKQNQLNKKKNPEDQYNPETDPNNDPEQQEGENSKSKGEGDDPDKTSGKEGDDGKKESQQNNQPDKQSNDNSQKSDNPSKGNGENQPNKERKEGESDEDYAARILKENSDAETQPIRRKLIRQRRPAKDW
jgi:Ca-activated chloride channel family protein